jgi:hypothetical protein
MKSATQDNLTASRYTNENEHYKSLIYNNNKLCSLVQTMIVVLQLVSKKIDLLKLIEE